MRPIPTSGGLARSRPTRVCRTGGAGDPSGRSPRTGARVRHPGGAARSRRTRRTTPRPGARHREARQPVAETGGAAASVPPPRQERQDRTPRKSRVPRAARRVDSGEERRLAVPGDASPVPLRGPRARPKRQDASAGSTSRSAEAGAGGGSVGGKEEGRNCFPSTRGGSRCAGSGLVSTSVIVKYPDRRQKKRTFETKVETATQRPAELGRAPPASRTPQGGDFAARGP